MSEQMEYEKIVEYDADCSGDFAKECEKSLIKKFRKQIWKKFVKAINDYDMIQEGDKIAVCISGGKDSMLLAKCFQELKRHGKIKFEIEFLMMNPGYNEKNKQLILDNACKLGIPLKMFETQIFDIVSGIEESPCYLCARMRRGYLYKQAQRLGCNKIALGHHMDDVIETTLMSVLYNGQFKAMMPKLHSTNFKGMELIRPMYLVREKDILAWKNYNNLTFIQCACRFTEKAKEEEHYSKRTEMKNLIKDLEKVNRDVAKNILKSIHNVNLDTVVGYISNKKEISFLDTYYKNGINNDVDRNNDNEITNKDNDEN